MGETIVRYEGDLRKEEFTLTDSAGNPVVLTGGSAKFVIKRDSADEEALALFAKTSAEGGGIEFTGAANGVLETEIDYLPAGGYYYGLRFDPASAEGEVVVQGMWVVRPAVAERTT